MLTVKKDNFDENVDDIMKSINQMLDNDEFENKKGKGKENQNRDSEKNDKK